MDIETVRLIERIRGQVDITPLDWDSPRTANEHYATVSEAVYDIADMVESYARLHDVMSHVYQELTKYRRVGEFMSQMAGYRQLCRMEPMVRIEDEIMDMRTRMTVDVLNLPRMAESLSRSMRFNGETSEEIVDLHRTLCRAINARQVVMRPISKTRVRADWNGAYDHLEGVNSAIDQMSLQRSIILEYQDDERDDSRRFLHDAFSQWDYLSNCPPVKERMVLSMARNAREWGCIRPTDLGDDMVQFLELYCAKLGLEHQRVQFRLMMLLAYHSIADRVLAYYRELLTAGEEYYHPHHSGYREFCEIQQFLKGGDA